MSNFYGQAIKALGYTGTYSVNDETDIDSIDWHGATTGMPTNAEIQAKSDEIAAAIPLTQLRAARNAKLAETDWMANSDVTMSAEWTAYRQALRDITDTYSSLDDVVWPTKPSE